MMTSARLDLDNKYREAKIMLHITHYQVCRFDFPDTWELAKFY
jgi:hypothetical protein